MSFLQGESDEWYLDNTIRNLNYGVCMREIDELAAVVFILRLVLNAI